MNCAAARELLPWLLNETLDLGERTELRAHLAGCADCRRELDETGVAWSVFEQHVPTETLVAYASGEPLPEHAKTLVGRHLARCALCRDEADLVERSGAPAEPSGAQPWRGRDLGQWVGLAAGLLVVIGASLAAWAWNVQRTANERAAELAATLERFERTVEAQGAELAEARGAAGDALERLAALTAPSVNPPVVELAPELGSVRGAETTARRVTIPADGAPVTLLLRSEVRGDFESYALEIRGVDGEPLWRGEGLIRQPGGDFTARVPGTLLPDDIAELVISGRRGDRWTELETFRFAVERR